MENLDARLARIEAAIGTRKYEGVAFIARRLGVSESYLRARPYLLPNYGVSDVPGRLLWHIDFINDWTEITPVSRERLWNAKPEKEKERVERSR